MNIEGKRFFFITSSSGDPWGSIVASLVITAIALSICCSCKYFCKVAKESRKLRANFSTAEVANKILFCAILDAEDVERRADGRY